MLVVCLSASPILSPESRGFQGTTQAVQRRHSPTRGTEIYFLELKGCLYKAHTRPYLLGEQGLKLLKLPRVYRVLSEQPSRCCAALVASSTRGPLCEASARVCGYTALKRLLLARMNDGAKAVPSV